MIVKHTSPFVPYEQAHGAAPQPDPIPDDTWTKAEIMDWMDAHQEPYPSGATKAKLLELIRHPAPS